MHPSDSCWFACCPSFNCKHRVILAILCVTCFSHVTKSATSPYSIDYYFPPFEWLQGSSQWRGHSFSKPTPFGGFWFVSHFSHCKQGLLEFRSVWSPCSHHFESSHQLGRREMWSSFFQFDRWENRLTRRKRLDQGQQLVEQRPTWASGPLGWPTSRPSVFLFFTKRWILPRMLLPLLLLPP